ncbi:hypothetical protein [Halegenticoccus tardaugens]|uniref:hypothetical protein n=1 Tax=Halegenticoccus tardaugens TaxID=2071624 RepID=UPI00100A38FF|nr:hypothetical protein [Halegenticoccus tardaugens]
MADTKQSRDKKAHDKENRQRERELEEARDRLNETEPPRDHQEEPDETQSKETNSPDPPRTCHRRGCEEPATFVVLERYQEETGHGAVEAEALLCQEHTVEEHPVNLESSYADYVFRIKPLPETESTFDT